MGKKLIIKNVNFSANAIDGHNYVHFILGGNTVLRGLYTAILPVGKKVGFADVQMWAKYKMAISLNGIVPSDNPTWDTQYSGESYIYNNVTILTQAVQIMIAPADGTSMTETQLAEINNNAFFVDD